jgi:hypothetical protein
VNWGEQTLLWYEVWGLGDVRLATWPRDRLGYFQQYDYPRRPAWLPEGQTYVDASPHCITCSLSAAGEARVFVNVDGTGPHAELRVEVLDERFQPVPGVSGDACIPVTENGLRTPVRWRGRATVPRVEGGFRLKLTMAGVRPEDVKLYAVYVS